MSATRPVPDRDRWKRLLAVVLFTAGCGGGPAAPTGPTPPAAPLSRPTAKPNFVFVLFDDARLDDIPFMRRIPSVMTAQGLTLANAYVTLPLCAPSRVSILTGEYVHNHRVWSNDRPKGGDLGFHDSGQEDATLAVWLKAAGYRTMLLGKYLNHYEGSYIPPGWDEWYTPVPGNKQFDYWLYYRGSNAAEGWEPHGHRPEDYEVDVLRDRAVDFIRRAQGQPFFAYINPVPPHLPHEAAPRYQNEFLNLEFHKPPSFNEDDLRDKPSWIQSIPRIQPGEEQDLIEDYRARLRSMLAVDEMIEVLVRVLSETQQLENTYLIVSSDNGWFLGEHRITQGKYLPYEEAVHMPLIIRGPGVPAGKKLEHLVSFADLAPTLLELARAPIPDSVDGRSLLPILGANPVPLSQWRRSVLFEQGTYWAVRGQNQVYIEWDSGFRELYDMQRDPYQLENLFHSDEAGSQVVAEPLAADLARLTSCKGVSCR